MKKSIFFLVAALVLTATSATAQNQVDKQGRRQGHWIRTDKDGSKIFEGDFKDGLETGVFTYYYSNGTVRMRNTYSVPGRVCQHEAYDEQGHLLATGTYNQRNRDGLWKFFAADGRLVKEASYKMGIKDGRHVIYNRSNDTAEVTFWQNNRRHGRWWKRIGQNGYITANYVNGNIEGRLVEYDDNGKLAREGYYSGGLKHGDYKYYEDGTLTIRERWNYGMMNDREILLRAPQPRWESIHDIVCMAAQGKSKTVIVLRDGSKIIANEACEPIFNRAGDELFALANRKSDITVARKCVQGIGKDKEGRDIVLLEPQPDFAIFPDEDAIKMIRSLGYEEHSPLQDIINR